MQSPEVAKTAREIAREWSILIGGVSLSMVLGLVLGEIDRRRRLDENTNQGLEEPGKQNKSDGEI